ncbi:MAG TPA: hypothetical protein VGG41_11745 [Solirubrobacteraceae bacterium]
MAYTNAEARQQLLDELAEATDEIGLALANLAVAYEQIDEASADRLEGELFRPLQLAYGQAQRTHADFAREHGLPAQSFAAPDAHAREHNAAAIIENAADAVARADLALASLQDSMLPVEVGDPPLRAGLERVRQLLDNVARQTREFTRTLGR